MATKAMTITELGVAFKALDPKIRRGEITFIFVWTRGKSSEMYALINERNYAVAKKRSGNNNWQVVGAQATFHTSEYDDTVLVIREPQKD